MIRYLVGLTLALGIQALRTQLHGHLDDESGESALAYSTVLELIHKHCEDIGEIERLGPVVKSISNFFQKKENKYTTVYPWALTMLAATRWGGISLFEQNTSHSMDHDLDFLLQMPGKTFKDAQEVVQKWRQDLLATTGLETVDITEGPLSSTQQRKLSEGGTESYRIAIVVKQKSEVGRNFADNRPFRQEFFDRLYRQKVPEIVPNLAFPASGALAIADKVYHDIMFKRFETLFGESEIVQHHYTMVDFWVNLELLGKDYQPSRKTKTLFMGSTFPFPENPEVIHKDIKATFAPDHKMQDTNSLCDLRVPSDLFSDDLQASPEMIKLSETCTKALSKQGYASLQYCVKK